MTDSDAPAPRPPFPAGVRAAGAIWLGLGALGLFYALAQAAPGGARPSPFAPCVGLAVAAGFLTAGFQTVTGRAKDTYGSGAGSVAVGVAYLGLVGVLTALTGDDRGAEGLVRSAALPAALGGLLIAAGVLAMTGRPGYRAWREAHQTPPAGDRPPRRQDE